MTRVQKVVRANGIEFSVFDARDSQTVEFLMRNFNERPPLPKLDEPPRLVVDLRAHVGICAFLYALTWPDAHIIAVEPNPENATNLALGIDANGLKNVTLVPCAVWNGTPVEVKTEFANTGSSCQFDRNFRNFPPSWPMSRWNVPSIMLDELVERVAVVHDRKIDFMKVDIEGAEFDVFHSFSHWGFVRNMFIELHPFAKTDSKSEAFALSNHFAGMLMNAMGDRVDILHPDFKELG